MRGITEKESNWLNVTQRIMRTLRACRGNLILILAAVLVELNRSVCFANSNKIPRTAAAAAAAAATTTTTFEESLFTIKQNH